MTSNSVADAVQSSHISRDLVELDKVLPSSSKNLNGRYCGHFFNRCEIESVGDVYMCCPYWLPVSIGNLNLNTMEEIWNSEKYISSRSEFTDQKEITVNTICNVCKNETHSKRLNRVDGSFAIKI